MITASVGMGMGPDAYAAGKDAAERAKRGLPQQSGNRLMLVFGSIALDQDRLVAGVSSVANGATVLGCSTAGEISGEGSLTEKTVVVLAIHSDELMFSKGIGHHILWNARRAGQTCAAALLRSEKERANAYLTFFDSVVGSGDATVSGLFDGLGGKAPVYGGAAGDDLLFFETYQYLDDKAYRGSVVAVGISGNCRIASSVMHGFLPIGLSRRVTKTDGTKVLFLDGRPAISVYEDYFGPEHAADIHKGLLPTIAASYPLGVAISGGETILRNPVLVGEDGSMTFTSPIPVGAEIRLMISDTERALETAELAAMKVSKALEGVTPTAVLVIESVARKRLLGTRAPEEIEILRRVFGREVPIAGFYGYAEAAVEGDVAMPLENGAMLIWAIAPR